MHQWTRWSWTMILSIAVAHCGREDLSNQRSESFEAQPSKVIDQQDEALVATDSQASDSVAATPSSPDSQQNDVIVLPSEPGDSVSDGNGQAGQAPPEAFAGFHTYRIQILEMKQDCSGDTTNIEQIRVKQNGVFLTDTFKDYPDNPNPNYNRGRIGEYEVSLTSSGNFDSFYPFEAFGGGFGAGWFSIRDSFADNVSPAPAIQEVWLDLSFGAVPVKLESIFINGGSSKLSEFAGCAPSFVEILGSVDTGNTWISLAKRRVDTEQGAEIPLVLPVNALAIHR